MRAAVFPGTEQERDDLLVAVGHHCGCATGGVGSTPGPCAPHGLVLMEETLKRLIFYRRWRLSLRRAEWLEEPRWTEAPGQRPS